MRARRVQAAAGRVRPPAGFTAVAGRDVTRQVPGEASPTGSARPARPAGGGPGRRPTAAPDGSARRLGAEPGRIDEVDHPVRDWRRTALVAVALLLLAGVLIAVAYTGGFIGRDGAALAESAENRTGNRITAAVTLTEIGNTVASTVIAIVAGGVLWWRGRRDEAVYVVATTGTASLVFTLIKRLLERPRPPAQLQVIRETNESLPSGHATMSAVVLGSIVIVAWPHLAVLGRAVLTSVAVLWVGGVGVTRIFLGVHWFSDVLAGWTLGLAWAFVGAAVLFWWRTRQAAPVPGAA